MSSRPAVVMPIPGAAEYAAAQMQVAERLDQATNRRAELLQAYQDLSNAEGPGFIPAAELAAANEKEFSLARKAHLHQVDWRVARLMYCKDPKYNAGLDPALAYEVQQKKAVDGDQIEATLAEEAHAAWAEKLSQVGRQWPSEIKVVKGGVPFVEAQPSYNPESDLWGRKLELRTLEEAMHGDVTKPMPRPVLFPEDYHNFKHGKYVKDDCPIS